MMYTKQLTCPICGGRLMDSKVDTISELREETKIEMDWNPDYITKCHKCGKLIAVRKVG